MMTKVQTFIEYLQHGKHCTNCFTSTSMNWNLLQYCVYLLKGPEITVGKDLPGFVCWNLYSPLSNTVVNPEHRISPEKQLGLALKTKQINKAEIS